MDVTINTVVINGMELTKAQLEDGLRQIEEVGRVHWGLDGTYLNIPVSLIETPLRYLERYFPKGRGFLTLRNDGSMGWNPPKDQFMPPGKQFKGFKQ